MQSDEESAPAGKGPAAASGVTEDDVDRYTRLLFFGLMNVSKKSDAMLRRRRLWRNHHRILDILSCGPVRSLTELAHIDGTSKQALHKSIQSLIEAKMVQVDVDPVNRRAKSAKLTPEGRRFEQRLDRCQHEAFYEVAAELGREKMQIWAEVMAAIAVAPTAGPPLPLGGRRRRVPAERRARPSDQP